MGTNGNVGKKIAYKNKHYFTNEFLLLLHQKQNL